MYELDIYTSGAQHLTQKSVAENMCSGFSKDKIKMKLYMQKRNMKKKYTSSYVKELWWCGGESFLDKKYQNYKELLVPGSFLPWPKMLLRLMAELTTIPHSKWVSDRWAINVF